MTILENLPRFGTIVVSVKLHIVVFIQRVTIVIKEKDGFHILVLKNE